MNRHTSSSPSVDKTQRAAQLRRRAPKAKKGSLDGVSVDQFICDPCAGETQPDAQRRARLLMACSTLVLLSGVAVAGVTFIGEDRIGSEATALRTGVVAKVQNLVESSVLFSNGLLADSKKLLGQVTALVAAVDFRSEEAIRQLAQKVQTAQSPVPADNSSPRSPTANLDQERRLVVSSTAAQTAEPARVGALEARTSGVRKVSSSEPAPSRVANASTGRTFDVGDKLKLSFYERVEVEEDKWGRANSAMRGFQQRPELSGEFEVQEDGTVSLPLLGSFTVSDHTAQEVQGMLADSFEDLTGRKGWVTVLSLERPPVYVMGPVDKPGSYKYVPGMTVLHAIALAGGLDRRGLEPWQKVETVREVEKRRGAAETLVKLIARSIILKAERDGEAPKPSLQLLGLVNEAEARQMIADSLSRRNFIIDARRNRARSLSDSVATAKQEVQMLSDRLRPLDDLIKLRQERVRDVESLVARNISSKSVLLQFQSDYSEATQRRREAMDQGSMAQQRAKALEQEKAKFDADTRGDIENEIAATDQQIAVSERDFASSEGVLDTLSSAEAQYMRTREAQATIIYEIIRQTAVGPISLTASGMSILRPGDLVRIVTTNEKGPREPPPTIDAMTGLPPSDDEGVQRPGSGTRLWGAR